MLKNFVIICLTTLFLSAFITEALTGWPTSDSDRKEGNETEKSSGQPSSTSTFKGKAFSKEIVIECPRTISCDRLFVGVENPNVPEGWNEKRVYNFTGSLEIYTGSIKAGALWCEYKLQGWSWQKPYLRLTRPIPTGYNCTAVHGGKFNCTYR